MRGVEELRAVDDHRCERLRERDRADGEGAARGEADNAARPHEDVRRQARHELRHFTIRLAVKTSPATTASFVSLARKGYFDHTIFHRIVPGFVIQGGDPTATGAGGPGYTTVDRPPSSTRYTLGVAAMAKARHQPAGAGGSQFFVVTAARRAASARLRGAREGRSGSCRS